MNNVTYALWGRSDGTFSGEEYGVFKTKTITASEGTNNLTVYAKNNSGVLNSSTTTFIVDATKPVVSITAPTNTTYGTTTRDLNYTATDTYLNSTWYVYNGTNTTLSGNTTFTALSNQQSLIYVCANDSAGNIGCANVTFTVDTAPPTYTNININNTTPKKNESILISALWNDNLSNLSYYWFSWNDTGSWVNKTATAFSGNWSNITAQVTTNKTKSVGWKICANDSLGNMNCTTEQNFTVINSAPTLTVSIDPSPAQISDDLNCTYTYSDMDSDAEAAQWFQWYVNGSVNATSQTLGTGNFSAGVDILCSVKVSDGTANSTWVNSSTLTVGDTIAPSFNSNTISATSGTVNTQFTFTTNFTEANTVNWVYLEITLAGFGSTNYTMVEQTHTGSIYIYNYTYTPVSTGTYSFKLYARDGSGNIGNYTSGLTYVASSPSVPPSGGGGAASETPEPTVNFVIYQYGGKYIANLPLQLIDCGISDVRKTYRLSIENRDVVPFTPKFTVGANLTSIVKIVYSGTEIPKSGVTDFTIVATFPPNATIGDVYEDGIYVSAGQTTQKIDVKFKISRFCIGGSGNSITGWLSRGFFFKIASFPSYKQGFPNLDIYLGYVGSLVTLAFLRKFPNKRAGGLVLFFAFIVIGNILAGGIP